jgi:hypothetical protein
VDAAADSLAIGECSDSVENQTGSSLDGTLSTTYWLLWLSDESNSMAVTPAQLTQLQNNSLNNWLTVQQSNITITLHDLNGTAVNEATGILDNDTLTWLNNQVQLLRNELPK